MSNTVDRDERYKRAELALEEYFALQGTASQSVSFETFVGQHPDLAVELRELHGLCGEVDQALERGQQAFSAQQAEVQQMLSGLDSPEFSQRYAVEREVGKGGMGAVYRVIDRKLDRPLAMKVILGQAEASRTGKTPPLAPRQLARFLNEAKITGQLDHPGIVPVHEVGVDHEGRAYFTMKLVNGRTMGEVFEARTASDPEWSTARVLGVIQRVCEALAFAHDRGVIHRDLKPANVMVGDFGEVYVMDWGLARRLGEKEEATPAEAAVEEELSAQLTMTREGQLLGTPTYMSPEQASGKLSEIGPASDIYAIGAMLYQLIAGHPPYCKAGEHPSAAAVIARILQGPPKPLVAPETPPELIAICEKALARDPKDRYSNTSAMAADLAAFIAGRVVRAYETGAWAEARKWVQRNRGLATASGAAVVVLIAGLVISLALKHQSDRNAKQAEDNAELAKTSEQRAVTGEALAKENERIATERADDVLRLSAMQKLEDLTAEADRLWPAHPHNIARYEAWLARAEALMAELSDHETKLAELRTKARPWSAEEQAQHRAEHAKLPELERVQRELEYSRRLSSVLESGEPGAEPTAAEVGLDLTSLPASAEDVKSLAWPLIDPERTEFGGERKGLVLARRAVELGAALSAADRARIRDSLAWALFANGRLDAAVEESEQALEEAGADKRKDFEGYVAKLRAAIEAAIDPEQEVEREKRRMVLEARIAALEAEVSERPEWVFADDEDKWWHYQLEKLVKGLIAFADERTGLFSEGTSEEHGWGVKKRLASAVSLRDGFSEGSEHARAWAAALPEIRAAYVGLAFTTQIGLVPIGPDPESKLWEFAHLETGEPAVRGADGRLVMTEATGLVFILLAGGTFQIGAQRTDPLRENYDSEAALRDGPVHSVTLSPFLMSKYEMTQGQWERATGSNPSQYTHNDTRLVSRLHPVEQISWNRCSKVITFFRLAIPSEEQWEYGARAGANSVWWTGNTRDTLKGAANLADQSAARVGANWSDIQDWLDLDDGYPTHAPVNAFRPNAYGLHNVHGNVWEWCLSTSDGLSYTQDALRASQGANRVIRGGLLLSGPKTAVPRLGITPLPTTLT